MTQTSAPFTRHELAALRDFGAYDKLTPVRGPYQSKVVSMQALEKRGLVCRITKNGLIWDWRMTPQGWEAYANV